MNRLLFVQVLLLNTCMRCLYCSPLLAQSVETIDRLRNKAETLYAQGDYDKAQLSYIEGYRIARTVDPIRAANLAVDISAIYHMHRDYRRGVQICQEGARYLKKSRVQPDSVWFKLNSSLGEMYKKLALQDSCYYYFAQANMLLDQHPDLENRIAVYVIYHYNNQGMMYIQNGGYLEGLSYLTKALNTAGRQHTSPDDMAILQSNLGSVYEQLGQFDRAIQLRRAAADSYRKADMHKYDILTALSTVALQTNRKDEALQAARQALAVYQYVRKAGGGTDKADGGHWALYLLGNYYRSVKNYSKATYFYDRISARKVVPGNTVYVAGKLGNAGVQHDLDRITKALAYCQQAIDVYNDGQRHTLIGVRRPDTQLFEAYLLKADLLMKRFVQTKTVADVRLAVLVYGQALDVADRIRKSYNTLDTKWLFTSRLQPTFVRAFEAAAVLCGNSRKSADSQLAFTLLERSKAATLSDLARELLIKPANVPAELIDRERHLQSLVTAGKLKLRGEQQAVDAQIELAQLQQRFEREFSAYYRARYQFKMVTPSQVQTTLDSRTAYLSYLVGTKSLYIAVVTGEGSTIVQKKGDVQSLKAVLRVLQEALYRNPGLGNYTGTAAAVTGYRWLIEPVAHLLTNKDRLIISPDADLHRIPFELLETGRTVDDFLVKNYAVSYTPSATALLDYASRSAVSAGDELLSVAPFAKPASNNLLPLPYLPASQAEVEQLPGDSWIGKAATKQRFMSTYSKYQALHFATHAFANRSEPAQSYIAFYPGDKLNRLYAGEIYNLNLTHTRLVMLSACETAGGKLQPGEGTTSLAQAFAYAGCPAVLSTLWNANDESTAYLSRQLYVHLQAGLPIDLALQRTRLDYFRSDLYRKLNHPHYWANLILTGDRQPLYEVPWDRVYVAGWPGPVIFLLLVMVGGCLLWRLAGNRRATV